MTPRTRYARSGDTNIAYQVHGDGPIDVLMNVGLISHLEHLWEEPGVVRMFDRMAEFARLILMDRRGTGLSDPIVGDLPVEEELEDLTAVLDAAGSERAALFGHTASGPFVTHYAAEHPERVGALVLYAATAVPLADDEAPWALTTQERNERLDAVTDAWGTGLNLQFMGPIASADPRVREWFGRLERLAASPGSMRKLSSNLERSDPRPVMPRVRVPTLVLHRKHDTMMDPRHSLVYAERIPGARYVELPGEETMIFLGDSDAVIAEVEEFLTGRRSGPTPRRRLLTVLFTDICDGTARAAELGDARWRDLLAAHDAIVRRELSRQDGREIKTTGDGFLAVFDGPPSGAVRAARAISESTASLGVELRTGLHTGECELIGDDVGGMAVHIAARVCALAGPREVLASGTTFGTVVGSGLEWSFEGDRDLKGVPGRWPLFRLAS
ncbi:MAG TPA: adenylate/guanylate cyclase domain-containing protein [Solirubrobacteraceae bacterium]|jgi:class 3 adenylate cyclase|nr:adenylate/guanylate cyclase domain-containing protein [Solirubrobacteraceae bacterium]